MKLNKILIQCRKFWQLCFRLTSLPGNFWKSDFNRNQVGQPSERKQKKISTHRYPSTATPGYYCPQVITEDDVIYCPNLPTFADKKVKSEENKNDSSKTKASTSRTGNVSTSNASTNSGGLSQRDSEMLLSFMTVPYLRLPLTLTFFSRSVQNPISNK